MTLTEQGVELDLTPADAVQVLEVHVYRSTAALDTGALFGGECTVVCGDATITTEVRGGVRAVKISRGALMPGNVVVVSTFVQTPAEVGAASWGLELLEG
jgi:hypothetical protein